MKIAVVVFLFGGASGGIKAANTIASQLSEAGHDVSILTCEDVKSTFFEVNKNVTLNTIGKMYSKKEYSNQIREDKEYLFKTLDEPFNIQRHKHSFVEDLLFRDLSVLQPDCVVSVLFQTHFFSIPAAIRAGIPIIASEHNSPKSYNEHWWMSKEELDYLHYLLKWTHKIHILSSKYKEGYPKYLHHKMIEIGNSVDKLDPLSIEQYKKENCIIGVGELSKWKNYEVLVDSFLLVADEFPDWKLKIYGEGSEKAVLLKKISQNPKISNRIKLMGILPHKEILKEVNKAKIFCHPSVAESFGLVVAEGLAAGLPAIGLSETDGVNALIKDGYNGYLVSSDHTVEEMAVALRKLMNDENLVEELGRNAIKSMEQYSNASILSKWNQMVNEVNERYNSNKLLNKNLNDDLPLISILIVCREGQKILIDSIKSIQNQTYVNIDCILIGLAQDEIVELNIHEYVQKIVSLDECSDYEVNLNVAIKKGIKYAAGDVICILDSSYCLDNFAIERAMYSLINNQQDLVVGSVVFHEGNNFKAEYFDSSAIWTGIMKVHPVIFTSKQLIDKLEFLEVNESCFAGFNRLMNASSNQSLISYDNSIIAHSCMQTEINMGEKAIDVWLTIAKGQFKGLNQEDTRFLLNFFRNIQEESHSNSDIGKLLYLIKSNINNVEFIYSIIKALTVVGKLEILQQKENELFEIKHEINSDMALKQMFTLKEFLKYRLRGTLLFKPAKYMYFLIKKIYRIS